MARNSSQSVIIVGGGIVGLCIAVVAQVRGHHVTLVARDTPEDTASGVAAGMIAPILESRSDPYYDEGRKRLQHAQKAWLDLIDCWPERLANSLRAQLSSQSIYIWKGELDEDDDFFFAITMKESREGDTSRDELRRRGISELYSGEAVLGDWLVDAMATLLDLQDTFVQRGGTVIRDIAYAVAEHKVRLSDGETLSADAVVLAAGYDVTAFADSISVLERVHPIKGHILDIMTDLPSGVVRSAEGYLAVHGETAKFGATMQAGRNDLAIEDSMVDQLKLRAKDMFPSLELDDAVPRAGVRASSPDSWPMIGRDPASRVLVATAMRRNGYVFAPLAARIITDLIEGRDTPGAEIYRPDRF